MTLPRIATRQEWLTARKALLAKEKAFTRERDAVSAARRELPMTKVDKPYSFESAAGKRSLLSLFDGKKQLLVYHFMFAPDWDAGCRSCSLVSETWDGALPHLRARDISFSAISRAPIAKLTAFQKRMGWSFPWVSSGDTDFNYDYGVAFREGGTGGYNYKDAEPGKTKFPTTDAPGLSVFLREGDDVFHTYSTYGRGLDILIGAYNLIDLTPVGRNEADLPSGMAWVKHHDKY